MLQKISGIEKFKDEKKGREEISRLSIETFLSHRPKNFVEETCVLQKISGIEKC